MSNIQIDKTQTAEKFYPLIDELTAFFINILQKLNACEKEMNEKEYQVRMNTTDIDLMTFWKEYDKQCQEIIDPIWIGKARGNMRSYGNPVAYEYIHNPSTKFTFIMKTATKAIIETEYSIGMNIISQDQFELKKEEENWKVKVRKTRPQKFPKWGEVDF